MTIFAIACAILIFCLCIWIASIFPVPEKAPYLRTVFYIVIALVAIGFLMHASGCTDLGLNQHIGK